MVCCTERHLTWLVNCEKKDPVNGLPSASIFPVHCLLIFRWLFTSTMFRLFETTLHVPLNSRNLPEASRLRSFYTSIYFQPATKSGPKAKGMSKVAPSAKPRVGGKRWTTAIWLLQTKIKVAINEASVLVLVLENCLLTILDLPTHTPHQYEGDEHEGTPISNWLITAEWSVVALKNHGTKTNSQIVNGCPTTHKNKSPFCGTLCTYFTTP